MPVLTDAPWSKRRPRRNPELWEESEAWKSQPLGGEIVLLVRPDRTDVARRHYHFLKEPESLQAWLLTVLLEDGVEVPDETRAAVAVRQRLRPLLAALFADDQTPHGRRRGAAVADLAEHATARELAPPDGALELWRALEEDDAAARADAKVLVYRLREAGERALGPATGPREFLFAAVRGGRLATTGQLAAAAAGLRTAIRRELAARPEGARPLDAARLAELRALGIEPGS